MEKIQKVRETQQNTTIGNQLLKILTVVEGMHKDRTCSIGIDASVDGEPKLGDDTHHDF
jgi:hypothetical protein